MKNENLLPPIIRDLIEELRKDHIPLHTRDNLCARLENIIECASAAVAAFRKKMVRHNTINAHKQKA